jgi:hypothetical protein
MPQHYDAKVAACVQSRTFLSKRPGLMSAGSSRSALLVAPMKTTPVSGVKPSISVSSWFSVCSRSSLALPSAEHEEAHPVEINLATILLVYVHSDSTQCPLSGVVYSSPVCHTRLIPKQMLATTCCPQ